ncbi:MAG: hypothetical protein U0Q16_34940 [Bryobacteraceae bacterium]
MPDPVADLMRRALESSEPVPAVESLLGQHPDLLERIGQWWAPGFCADRIPVPIARLLVERGAPLSVHAAAGFGFIDRIDPSLVHAKGGDGCTPLHFARDLATAQFLLDHGAVIDARDEDHDSTPAQWRIGDSPDVVRYLLSRCATPDIFIAAALGDRDLAARLIRENPACVSYRIGRLPAFPPIGHKGRGGTILQWSLAFNSYPHQIALLKGHRDLFDLLYEHSDDRTRLLVNCVLARRDEAMEIAAQHPDMVASLEDADLQLPALYCWETNTNLEAVRLMLDLGFPVAHPERSHGYSALHNAAWSGSAALVDLLVARGAPVALVDPRYQATPLGYALHDCLVEKRHPEGEFAKVVESLLRAGSPWKRDVYPTGDERVNEVFRRFNSR